MGNSTVHFVKTFLISTALAQEIMWSRSTFQICFPIRALIVKWFLQPRATSPYIDQESILDWSYRIDVESSLNISMFLSALVHSIL